MVIWAYGATGEEEDDDYEGEHRTSNTQHPTCNGRQWGAAPGPPVCHLRFAICHLQKANGKGAGRGQMATGTWQRPRARNHIEGSSRPGGGLSGVGWRAWTLRALRLKRAASFSTMQKVTGTMSVSTKVAPIMPPMTTVPRVWREIAPEPE